MNGGACLRIDADPRHPTRARETAVYGKQRRRCREAVPDQATRPLSPYPVPATVGRVITTRRAFLGLAAATGLSACTSTTHGNAKAGGSVTRVPTRTTAPTGTTAPPGRTSAPPARLDWSALGRGLAGTLVRPGEASYDSARLLFNPRFDGVRPEAIARCANADDVAECVRFAGRYGIPVALRSGGHCYAGWSTGPGLVIDVAAMSRVEVSAGTATVGAGARLIDVYATLAGRGVAIPAGSCPTVGVAGLTLGGGIGVVGRAWGLTCDNLTAVEIVTADGRVDRADGSQNADLFWACRGGGGGTFGAVTSLTFRTHPVTDVATWYLDWPWSSARAVIAGWQRWAPRAPDELWTAVHLSSAPTSSTPTVSVVGTYLGGDTGTLERLLDGLVAAAGVEPDGRSASTRAFLAAMLFDAGCEGETVAQCHLAPAGEVQRQPYAASSDWITRPLPAAGIDTLLHAVQSRHETPGAPDVAVELDAAGGAINRVPGGATAFVHRDAICSVQYIANWYDGTPAAMIASAAAWPHATRQSMQSYVSGQAYQNYVDPAISSWQRAYFGENYARLRRVKVAYDSRNVFRHAQSVPPG